MRRFKPKRKLKKRVFLRLFLLIFFLILSFKLVKSVLKNNSNYIIRNVLQDLNYSFKNEKTNILARFYDYTKENVINKPDTMLVSEFEYKNNKKTNNKEVELEINEENKKQIENENQVKISQKEPLIYIYSSHQKEGYDKEYMEDYNVNPDVFLASHILQEKLINSDIPTLVMEDDISAYLNNNNLNYNYSYVASRYYLKPVVVANKSIKLFIDLHRDSAPYDTTTVTIDDKKYAKVMFVIGKEYDTYQNNLAIVTKINDKINAKYPSLSRGILQKEGKGVNGVYNQDLDSRIILIELGGDKNNLKEVINTIDVLNVILGEYINEA